MDTGDEKLKVSPLPFSCCGWMEKNRKLSLPPVEPGAASADMGVTTALGDATVRSVYERWPDTSDSAW